MKRKLFALAAFAALTILVAACGGSSSSTSGGSSAATSSSSASGSSSSASNGTIKVLAITDTSGPNKVVGVPELDGLQAGAAYYNAHGGILGHKVDIVVKDDNGDPTQATTNVVQALGSNPNQYTMIWGGEEGTITAALIPVIARYKPFTIAINDGTNLCQNSSHCPSEFILAGAPTVPEVAQAQWFKSKGYKNVGIIYEEIAFTQTEAQNLTNDLKALGIKSESVGLPTSATSATPEMSTLKSAGAQAVYAAGFGAPQGYIYAARPELNWPVPILWDAAGSSVDISKLAPASQLPNSYETPFYCLDKAHSVPGLAAAASAETTPISGALPCSTWGQGFDALAILNAAAKKAGSVSSSALSSAMTSLHLTTADDVIFQPVYCWTTSDHENTCNAPSAYTVTPVGSISGGRLQPVGAS